MSIDTYAIQFDSVTSDREPHQFLLELKERRSARIDFAKYTSAESQAETLAFLNARLREELDAKVAELAQVRSELEMKVAERTSQLAAANEELKKQIAQRGRVEKARPDRGAMKAISQTRIAGPKLREGELNLRLMTETIPEMLWSAGPDGKVDYCNARVLHYSGLSAKEIIAGGWKKLLHPDDVGLATRAWMSSVATGALFHVEVRILNAADGTYRWCITSALPLLDKQGLTLKWFGTIVDMHDWKLAQEELRNAQAELAHVTRVITMGQLTASICHEVNQPLAGIITNSSTCLRMLAADPPNIDGARETARRTIRDGNRASEVITRLRALFSKKHTTSEPMDLNEAAQEVIALSINELQRRNVILRTELSGDLPLVTGDRVQLQQVILNLVRNASDAMKTIEDRPRELFIRTERDHVDYVRMSVQDTGIGFDPQFADRLFQAFYTSKSDGMGIGLSVCRSIIENHRGRLWAALNDGPGATFSFSVPCTEK